MTNSFASGKSAEAFRTISEVADALKLPQHVLRFWETRFVQVKPLKRGGGRRFYRPEDVDLLMSIRQLLYGDGYTIKGVQRILKEQGPRAVAALAQKQAGQAPPTSWRRAEASGSDRDAPVPAEPGLSNGPFVLQAVTGNRSPEALANDDEGGLDPSDGFGPEEAEPSSHRANGNGALREGPRAALRAILVEVGECRRILEAAAHSNSA